MSYGPAADLHETLRSTFGFTGFRGRQEAVVQRVLAGEHACALMPTGAGKSLCYQLPALVRRGTGIVISPLIALMHDQIRAARAMGIRAASMTSADSDNVRTAAALRAGELDLLYVAPERATTPGFAALLEQADIALFAIDEAHCVSEWGHDFRPDYRQLRPLLDRFADIPRLALTATADEVTRRDILVQLGIPEEGLIVAGFDRENIRYAISARTGLSQQIGALLARNPGPGIVYASSRKQVEDIASRIAQGGRAVGFYHAGLDPAERARVQQAFVQSDEMVMVATIAFGMGIDKPDVRFVIHAGLPKSIEAYYQETGRAGRDGDPAEAQMFWSPNDFAKARLWLAETETSRQPSEKARLDALAAFVEAPSCRRAILLSHFGENPNRTCGNCDNCLDPPAVLEVTEIAQKLLSAVYRTGQSFGLGHIEKVLLGREDERVRQRGHDRLSVFGILGEHEAPLLRPVMRNLTAHGVLVATDHGGLALGDRAKAVLAGEQEIVIAKPPAKKSGARYRKVANPDGDPLFEALRAKRKAIASERSIPAYIIFHDSVLRDMAAERPTTMRALGEIAGIGAKKLETFGEDFCAVIREHQSA